MKCHYIQFFSLSCNHCHHYLFCCRVSWDKASKIFVRKMEMALDKFYELRPYSPGKINNNATNDDFDEMKKRLIQLAEDFDGFGFIFIKSCVLCSSFIGLLLLWRQGLVIVILYISNVPSLISLNFYTTSLRHLVVY